MHLKGARDYLITIGCYYYYITLYYYLIYTQKTASCVQFHFCSDVWTPSIRHLP